MPGANSEQLKAIEHHGGALLSAGAGSGKTFVLTEHLIYLAKNWIETWSPETETDFGRYIKSKFSKVVLMTFTKKAAGEIEIRIGQKFEKAFEDALEEKPEQAPFWEKAIENLDALTISTIHGYCYKLIKQGFFADINPNDEIIGEGEFGKQIEDIFNSFLNDRLDQGLEGLGDDEKDFLEMVFKERRSVVAALKSIISDPTLRLMWKNMDPGQYSLAQADAALKDLMFHQSFNEIFDWSGELAPFAEFEGKDWFAYLQKVSSFVKKGDLGLLSINEFARELADDDFKIARKPSAKAVPQQAKDLYEQAKEFKDFLKSNHEDLFVYEDSGLELVRNWYGRFRELFNLVESAYGSSPGFTFGDLEFIVNEKLEDKKVREMVKLEYNYMIVDEFQDTSYIQFNILGKIVDFDYHKVFCVGDIKQAIYGFRGGELGVFLDMEKKTPLNLQLLNNYRSDQDIILFNNSLFEHLFALGLNFEGRDHYAVEVVSQTVPIAERARGEIFEIETDLSFLESEANITKLSSSDVEYMEALALADEIRKSSEEEGVTAVLYRKLKPSKVLMQLLIEADIGFTSQVKVPMLEDPVLGIFHLLVKSEFDQGELKKKYLEFTLEAYFKLLGKEDCSGLRQGAENFRLNLAYYGVYQSFLIFLASAGVSVSNYQQSLENISLIIDMVEGDLSKIVHKLEEWSGLSYSMDFQYGKDPGKVVIMSAHASKGLEFNKVLLGGIYTNDSSMPMKDMFGKSPYSFKWSKGAGEKKKYKSPHYMLELAAQKRKEFSEAKRLFYVACTRAENSLGWARLRFGALKATTVKGSWIYGIDSFFANSEEGSKFKDGIEKNLRVSDIKASFDPRFLERISNQPPMFHYDNLGLEQRIETAPSFLMPELSVTRLAQVALCPRKFYLGNILKLDKEFESDASSESDLRKERLLNSEMSGDVEDLSSKSFDQNLLASYAERGIEVHELLSRAIKSGFVDLEGGAFQKQLDWVVEKLKAFGDNANFISESPIKFELFQYMISGIPDLIVSDENQNCIEVWDFKTGKLKEHAPENYWFQLYAYAYAGFANRKNLKKEVHGQLELGVDFEERPIKLVLCYVDERKVVERIVSKNDVENYLWSHCLNLGQPDKVEPEHCERCDFNKICKGKSLSSCATSDSC